MQNIVVVGNSGSGKTAFVRRIIHIVIRIYQRLGKTWT